MALETKTTVYQNFVNGEWKDSESGETMKSLNPANFRDVVGYIQSSTNTDADEAVQAADAAKIAWRKMGGVARGDFLFKAAAIMEERIDDIARTMTSEMGKTLPEAIGETKRAIAILRYYAGEGMRSDGDVIPATDPGALMYSKRIPLGVVGIITPWNFPAAIPIWKAAPALIYGNTIVMKPASEAAVTTIKIMACLADAGFPKGVVNVVNGRGSVVGDRIINHPLVHGITFTGSNYTGKRIAETAAARGVKYQLEMGGKNPVIIDEDADLDMAVQATISGGLRSAGQKCTCTSRVIVHEKIYDAFKDKLVTEVNKLTVGNGLESATWMGPSVSEKQLGTVLGYIEKGKQEGGKVIAGGNRLLEGDYKNGYFVEPTVFENVDSKSTIGQEEIFGPVLAMIKVSSFEEAIQIANDVDYGLSASIFTTNIAKALEFIDEMDAGLVRVNAETAGVELQAPFGGMKQSSSHSREQGQAAKEFFTSTKTIFIKG